MGWDLLETLIWYLFGVETCGKTLEELDDVFNADYPPRAKSKELVAIKTDGHVDLVQDA